MAWHLDSAHAQPAPVVGLSDPHVQPAELPDHLPRINSISEFWQIAQASGIQLQEHLVDLEFNVAIYDPSWHLLWAEEKGNIHFIPTERIPFPLKSGQRVRMMGKVIPGVGLELGKLEFVPLKGVAIHPEPISGPGVLQKFATAEPRFVTVEGYIDRQVLIDSQHLELILIADSRQVVVRVLMEPGEPVPNFEGKFVEITGVCVWGIDHSGEVSVIQLWVQGLEQANEGDHLPSIDGMFAIPVTRIENLQNDPPGSVSRIIGKVQSQDTGRMLVVRDQSGQIQVFSPQSRSAPPGSIVEAIGRSVRSGTGWLLVDALFRPHTVSETDSPSHPASNDTTVLRLAEQVLRLSPSEAAQRIPARISGVVTYSHPSSPYFFVQDATAGLCVTHRRLDIERPPPGVAVELEGFTDPGDFAPIIHLSRFQRSGPVPMPPTRFVTLEHALTGVEDSQWVEMQGFLRKAEISGPLLYLHMTSSAGEFVARIPSPMMPDFTPGSVLRLRGVCATAHNERRQLIGIKLNIPSLEYVHVEVAAPLDPFSLPLRSIASLGMYQPILSADRQVLIKGSVIHHIPGRYLLIEEAGEVIQVFSRDTTPLSPGDLVEAAGVPGRLTRKVVLREAIYRITGPGEQSIPIPLPPHTSVDPEMDGRLTRLSGYVLNTASFAGESKLYVRARGTPSEVVFEHGEMREFPSRVQPGALVSLIGVYLVDYDEFNTPRSYRVLLRNLNDLDVIRAPSWWTTSKALSMTGILLGVLLLILTWVYALRSRVKRQTVMIRRQLEAEANLEATHRSIIDNASDFVFTLSAEGRFTSFNPAGERLTGYSRDEQPKLKASDLFEEDTLARFQEARSDYSPLQKALVFQSRIRRKDGSQIWVETSAKALPRIGEGPGILAITRDISLRKAMEEQLRKARDAAEAATAAKSAFLANMSHEIRTPMNGIIGMANLLTDSPLAGEQRSFAETITQSAESLLAIIDDILDLSKVESGKMNLESQPFEVAHLVDGILDILSPRASEKGIRLSAIISRDVPGWIRGDALRLRQILLNLVGNAVKFTEMGWVTIRVEVVTSGNLFPGIRFAVEDSGPGISPESLAQIFHPFSQADSTTTRKHGGTGLGLAISQSLAALMGGQINAESQPGVGSVFSFVIPLEQANSQAGGMDMSGFEGMHILLYEPDSLTSKTIEEHLSASGINLSVSANASDASRAYNEILSLSGTIDGVIVGAGTSLDERLEFCSWLKSRTNDKTTPCILLNNSIHKLSETQISTHAISRIIPLPLRKRDLILALRAIQTPDPAVLNSSGSEGTLRPASSGIRALVVEDNKTNQRVALMQLKRLGVDADSVYNGKDAIEHVEKNAYDLILMDCQMPEMDGYEATRQIRARHGSAFYIVAMTANAMQGDRELCLEAGMDDYLSKPVRMADLEALVHRIRSRQARSASD